MEKQRDKKAVSSDILKRRGTKPKNIDIEQPSQEEFAEVCTPSLSSDSFQIADRVFQIRLSNIVVQKLMAKSLDGITDLIAKIDIREIVKKFRQYIEKRSADIIPGEGIDEEDDYAEFVSFVKNIITSGGVSNIVVTIMDLYLNVIYAICKGQDESVELSWLEENVNFNQIQEIFFKQMEKDKIGGKVINFLALATQLVTPAG